MVTVCVRVYLTHRMLTLAMDISVIKRPFMGHIMSIKFTVYSQMKLFIFARGWESGGRMVTRNDARHFVIYCLTTALATDGSVALNIAFPSG